MANFIFNNAGVASRRNIATGPAANGTANPTAFTWQIPANSTIGRHVVYNESDSTIDIPFNLASGFGVGTNDNAGNTIEIMSGFLRVRALSSGIVSVTRGATSTSVGNAATTPATNSARTSHGTASAVGGRQDSNRQSLGERVIIQPITS